MRMAKFHVAPLARFTLYNYNSSGMVENPSNGADVTVLCWRYVRATIRHIAYYDCMASF